MRLQNRKWMIIPGILVLLIIFLVLFLYNTIDIGLVNTHVDIEGFKLLDKEEKWEKIILKDFTNIGLFGGRGFFNEKDGVEVIFTGYPDVIDKPFLTHITSTNPSHSVFDTRVGEDVDKAAPILSKKGFIITKYNQYYAFSRNKVGIILYFDDKRTITKIAVSLRVTNKQNVQF